MAVDKFRPLKWDEENRRSWITEDIEVTFRSVSDSNGNIIYLARARVGTEDSEFKWQIKHLSYDSNNNPYMQLWPENSDNLPSSHYEFQWISEDSQATITGISANNPAVVTANNTFSNGDKIIITGVEGMTEVNFDGNASDVYTVANATATNFELSGVNSTTYTPYSSGGVAKLATFASYTYG